MINKSEKELKETMFNLGSSFHRFQSEAGWLHCFLAVVTVQQTVLEHSCSSHGNQEAG
jgi:hypothetical protein